MNPQQTHSGRDPRFRTESRSLLSKHSLLPALNSRQTDFRDSQPKQPSDRFQRQPAQTTPAQFQPTPSSQPISSPFQRQAGPSSQPKSPSPVQRQPSDRFQRQPLQAPNPVSSQQAPSPVQRQPSDHFQRQPAAPPSTGSPFQRQQAAGSRLAQKPAASQFQKPDSGFGNPPDPKPIQFGFKPAGSNKSGFISYNSKPSEFPGLTAAARGRQELSTAAAGGRQELSTAAAEDRPKVLSPRSEPKRSSPFRNSRDQFGAPPTARAPSPPPTGQSPFVGRRQGNVGRSTEQPSTTDIINNLNGPSNNPGVNVGRSTPKEQPGFVKAWG
eukprot:501341_1